MRFENQIRNQLNTLETEFIRIETQLLERKTFEDMAFHTSGFCEHGDFFYYTAAADSRTVRDCFAEYLKLKESFDTFASGLLSGIHRVAPNEQDVYKRWAAESLNRFQEELHALSV